MARKVDTGHTLSGSLAGIVNDIRVRSLKYMAQEGVLKGTVTPVGVGQKGNAVTEPNWDPTGRSEVVATEGIRFTAYASYVSATKKYTSVERAHGTVLTYNVIEDASESVRDEHARAHGIVHAIGLEKQISAVFASFTTNTVSASGKGTGSRPYGLTLPAVAQARAKLTGQVQAFTGPFSLAVNHAAQYYLWNSLTHNPEYGPTGSLGDKLLDKYYAGTLLGDVRVFYSNAGITQSGTGATVALYEKGSIGLFMPRPMRMETDHDIDLRGYKVLSTRRAGARVRMEKAGCNITTLTRL